MNLNQRTSFDNHDSLSPPSSHKHHLHYDDVNLTQLTSFDQPSEVHMFFSGIAKEWTDEEVLVSDTDTDSTGSSEGYYEDFVVDSDTSTDVEDSSELLVPAPLHAQMCPTCQCQAPKDS